IPVFETYLNNNQHVMIKAPRRFGKTSLVKHVIENQKKYTHIYIDIRRADTLKTLSNQILDSAYSFVGVDNLLSKAKKSLLTLSKTLKTIKIGSIADLTLEHIESDTNENELFLHSLDVVQEVANKKKINIKFIFDEFQDITNIADKDILEKLRSVAQHHEDITYIFLGSIESMMSDIFESKASPFFHFARVMPLNGLDIDELSNYVFSEFTNRKFKFDNEAILLILNFLQGHPDYSMQVLQSIFYRTILDKKDIDLDLCVEVLKEVILENRAYLDELIQKAKSKKHLYKLLKAIANNHTVDIPSKTLYNSHIVLEDMGLIRNISRGKYELVDVFLNVLLQQNSKNILLDSSNLELSLT
ncbi:MAG: ATP-binding protein, partial [Campylobacterota bacterium]|nr:ATP-binding protein [Campylobacterota bacterium]